MMKKLLFLVTAAVAVGFSHRLNAEVRTASNPEGLTAAISAAAIDAGDPASTAWVRERSPRGHRVNLGAYGGTPYSSGIATGFMIIVR